MIKKQNLAALLFIAALLMLSFEAAPGEYWLIRQLLFTLPAIIMLFIVAILTNRKDNIDECKDEELL